MHQNTVSATYLVETPLSLDHAAAAMAGEQSTGTFIEIPGETPELRERHAARVLSIEDLGEVDGPALPTRGVRPGTFRRGRVTLSFPLENIGTALPQLLATVAGNLFELRQLTGIRLEDLDLPTEFTKAHPGPAFGVEGTREVSGVYGRPLIGTIVKPSVGLTPDETAELAGRLARAGLDFIKDDELMGNPPHSPFDERVTAVMGALHDAADATGRLAMYAVNVTDGLDAMLRHVDVAESAGATCVMVSVNAVGVSALEHLRGHTSVTIHAHRNGWGALTRDPSLGYSLPVWQKLWRLAGADHVHVNGLRNKFWEPDDSVIRSARAVLAPINDCPPSMPVFSSGQSAAQVADTFAALGTSDLLYVCGGGIMAHPDGVGAGVESIREAWEAALSGTTLDEYATEHRSLRRALELFG